MNILVVGDPINQEEILAKFGNDHEITTYDSRSDIQEDVFFKADLAIDFFAADEPESLEFYEQKPELNVLIDMARSSFGMLYMFQEPIQNQVFGFNGLPTFVNRPLIECSVAFGGTTEGLEKLCKSLKTDYEIVADRIGMVTPRIICMIINEAYYTLQEGTANKEDIDQAMKLGTNYPYGPFEWSKMIGLDFVFELLEAVYLDTKDERYKICPLLKQEYFALA